MLEVELGKTSRAKNQNEGRAITSERKAVIKGLLSLSLIILSHITYYNLI
jgi:hypothetical protein